jgi:hypothetical protein
MGRSSTVFSAAAALWKLKQTMHIVLGRVWYSIGVLLQLDFVVNMNYFLQQQNLTESISKYGLE